MRTVRSLTVPIITPKENSGVDQESLKRLIHYLTRNKVNALFALGTTGEFQNLTMAEKEDVIDTSIKANVENLPLLVGVSAATIEETQELIKLANHSEVEAVVLAPLFGEGEVSEKANMVLRQSKFPVLLYNNPAIHGNRNLSLDIVQELAADEKVIGIKDSSEDTAYFAQLLQLSSNKFGVFQGSERTILASLDQNIRGLVSGSANVCPDLFSALIKKQYQNTMAEIIQIKREIKQISANYIQGIKTKLMKMGIIESDELFQK